MGEAQTQAVDLENPRLERLGEPSLEASADGRLHQSDGRIRQAPRRCARPRAPRSRGAATRARRSSSRSDGIGSSSPGASVPPLRCSAVASSSAKKGLPCEVSQSLISVGRGNAASRRVAEQLVGRADAQAADLDRSQSLLGHGAAEASRRLAANRQQRGDRLSVEAGERVAQSRERRRRPTTGRRRPRGRAGRRAASSRSTPRNAAATARSSAGVSDSPSSKAASSARRWIGGSSGNTSPAALPRRSVSPANENWVSASDGRDDMTRYPPAAAASRPASHSDVLPIPASPDSTATPGSNSGASKTRKIASEFRFPADKLRRCDGHMLILCALGRALKPLAAISSLPVAVVLPHTPAFSW